MKVKDVVRSLNNYDPELEVVMSSDAEGNGFSPVCTYSSEFYVAHSGEIVQSKKEDHKAEKVVIIWPEN